jgi:hypothetical protein
MKWFIKSNTTTKASFSWASFSHTKGVYWSAKFFSAIFHPLLMLTYQMLMLLTVNPYLFGLNKVSDPDGIKLLLVVFAQSFLLPGAAVMMMKLLGLVGSLEMPERNERIGPFIATGIFYLWLFQNANNSSVFHTSFAACALGGLVGMFLAFVINIFWKISIHALGMGGWCGAVYLTMRYFSYGTFPCRLPFLGDVVVSMNLVLMLSIFIAGIVASSRLILKAHTYGQLLGGFALGFITQIVALRILT